MSKSASANCDYCVMMTSSNGNIFRVTGQWRGTLMFSLICVWINGWVNNREAGDLRRYHAYYDVTVMCWSSNWVSVGLEALMAVMVFDITWLDYFRYCDFFNARDIRNRYTVYGILNKKSKIQSFIDLAYTLIRNIWLSWIVVTRWYSYSTKYFLYKWSKIVFKNHYFNSILSPKNS